MKFAIFVALITFVYAGIDGLQVTIPPGHPNTCAVPSCDNATTRAVRFPAPDAVKFYQCVHVQGTEWKAELYSCQCNTLFDFEKQKCVNPLIDIWMQWCQNTEITNRDPFPCS